MTTALITGITGQDGAYLAQLLLSKGYTVVGLQRRSSNFLDSRWRLRLLGIEDEIVFQDGDITDPVSVLRAITIHQPDEIYNLAAQSFVGTSWEQPHLTSQVTGLGALNVFEAVRHAAPEARVYQAGSSEMFGNSLTHSQNEETPFRPRSPYGVAKVFAHQMAINYRESHGLFISNGILFNHESPLRGPEFVTSKVCRGAARIARGFETTLELGNLNAKRDWGHARDYVEGMWLMLQHDVPDDFVLATGVARSIEELCDTAFRVVGLDWRQHVTKNPELFRPAELHTLCGDATKAKRELGWSPSTSFLTLIREMVSAEWGRCLKDLPCT